MKALCIVGGLALMWWANHLGHSGHWFLGTVLICGGILVIASADLVGKKKKP